MFNRKVRNAICKSAFFAAVITMAPSVWGQSARVALPGSAAYDALPAAISPISSSAKATPVSYSTQSFSTIRIPEENSVNALRETNVESLPSRRNWLLLSLASSSAATFDAYSTRRSLASGNVENDPMMRPFAGSPAIYAAIQASPLLMDYAALKMQHSRNIFVRRLWWVPQTSGTAMSIFAGVHNLSISR